jgi:hypothetical protein
MQLIAFFPPLTVTAILFARRRRMQRWQSAQLHQTTTPHTGYFAGPNYYQQQQNQGNGRYYESQNPNHNYGPDASGWQPPPPLYEPPKDGKAGVPSYAPPQGAPPQSAACAENRV